MKKTLAILLAGCMLFSACGKKTDASYNVDRIVQITFSDIDAVCDSKELSLAGQEVLTAMQAEGSVLLSLVVDSEIEITPDEMERYDHLVMTNPEWIDRFDDRTNLKRIAFENLPMGMQDFLSAQMPLWTADESVLPDGVALYEYEGGGLFAYPANVGYGPSALQAKKPLVVLIDAPAAVMNPAGFLLPLASSGNLVFDDAEALRAELDQSAIGQFVLSIDNIKTK